MLDRYVHSLFEEKLVIKRVNGREIGPRALGEYIKAYTAVFREGHLPKALTLVQAIAFTTNFCAKDEAFRLYKQDMDAKCGGSNFLSTEDLSGLHSTAKNVAFLKFDTQAIFGKKENIMLTRKELEASVIEEYNNYVKANKFKMQAGLEKYLLPILLAVAAFLLDTITDWTCDAWSQTCRSLSRLMAILYYMVFFFMLYQFFQVYKKQGTAAVGITAMGLGQSVFQRVDDYRHTIASSIAHHQDNKVESKKED